nr:hypothetical protein [Shimia biformata]
MAFLSVPKTGTTAYEQALRKYADIVFTKRVKHMTVGKYHTRFAPFLEKSFGQRPERLAVMRDPIEQIRSWYRYRSAERLGRGRKSTGGLSFDEFVLDVISDRPPAYAGIGSQFKFLSIRDGSVPVHHLFLYENQPLLREFLEDRFEDEITFKERNVSPTVDAPLSRDVEKKLRAARPEEFALYARIQDAGGVLRQDF